MPAVLTRAVAATSVEPGGAPVEAPARRARPSAVDRLRDGATSSHALGMERGMDTLDPERRSRLMGRIRGVDTGPEMAVRRAAHRLGYRFRLHRKNLPGRPDLVFPSRRAAIFVHGCFWHRHEGCRKSTMPRTRVEFWQAKFDRNVERDLDAQSGLAAAGWRVLVIWECQIAKAEAVDRLLLEFLGPAGSGRPVASRA